MLEIGCGPGAAAREIARRVDPGRVLGIDRSPTAIAQATAAGRAEVAAGLLEFRCTAAEDLVLAPGEAPYDLALAIRVGALDGRHPEAGRAALPRIAAALKPGGRLSSTAATRCASWIPMTFPLVARCRETCRVGLAIAGALATRPTDLRHRRDPDRRCLVATPAPGAKVSARLGGREAASAGGRPQRRPTADARSRRCGAVGAPRPCATSRRPETRLDATVQPSPELQTRVSGTRVHTCSETAT